MRIAATADVHYGKHSKGKMQELFAQASREADVLLICGDLTDYGLPEEAELLAHDIRAHVRIPVLGVIGNHDFESGHPEAVRKVMEDAGVTMLDGESCDIDGVGFAGTKGFIGGFGRGELAPFGEPIVKAMVDEVLTESRKLENQLRTLRTERSVTVLHYSPILGTIEGEPPQIFQYLGSQRLCEPIDRFDHGKAVVHGHAHHGTYEGRTPMGRPVYNVAQFVLKPLFGKPYVILEV